MRRRYRAADPVKGAIEGSARSARFALRRYPAVVIELPVAPVGVAGPMAPVRTCFVGGLAINSVSCWGGGYVVAYWRVRRGLRRTVASGGGWCRRARLLHWASSFRTWAVNSAASSGVTHSHASAANPGCIPTAPLDCCRGCGPGLSSS